MIDDPAAIGYSVSTELKLEPFMLFIVFVLTIVINYFLGEKSLSALLWKAAVATLLAAILGSCL